MISPSVFRFGIYDLKNFLEETLMFQPG